MYHSAKAAVVAIVCLTSVASPAQSQRAASADCDVYRVLPDGREVRTKSADVAVSHGIGSGRSGSVSVRSRSGHSRSSASAFSSSSTGSRGSARAVSSVTDENGRTVTTTHDEKGCKVVIDDR